MNTSVCYCAPFTDASGYGEASRNAIRALYEAGADLKTEKLVFTTEATYLNENTRIAASLADRKLDYKIKIIHTTPDVYKNYIEKGKYNIGHLFWETSSLPKDWVLECNRMNEIWTGTQMAARVIQQSGVTVPVHVYPQSVNTEVPQVRKFKLPNFNGVTFYSMFEWNERKNPKALLNAFWREFKTETDVCLLIKTQMAGYSDASEIVKQIKLWKNELGFKETPRLFIKVGLLTEEEKHRIHETGDCFVITTRGEGWGIPIAEATLHNKPVISPKYGGIVEYFSARHYYQVNHNLVDIDKRYNKYYDQGMKWAQVDEESLRTIMRKVYSNLTSEKHKTLPKIKSGSAGALIRSLFNYEVVGTQMLNRLEEISKLL